MSVIRSRNILLANIIFMTVCKSNWFFLENICYYNHLDGISLCNVCIVHSYFNTINNPPVKQKQKISFPQNVSVFFAIQVVIKVFCLVCNSFGWNCVKDDFLSEQVSLGRISSFYCISNISINNFSE